MAEALRMLALPLDAASELEAGAPVASPKAKPVAKAARKVAPKINAELRSGPLVQLTDAELARMSSEGDTTAYAELVMRYQVLVRNVAKSMVSDYQDAEDLAQETFIKAFNSLHSLHDTQKFSAWLFTILRHTVLDFLRSRRGNVSLETLLEEGFEPKGEEAVEVGAAALESHEEDIRTLEALASLREDYREVIVLKHVEKLSYKEIAQRLNMSVSAVGEKLSRVRALLKRRIEKKSIKPRVTQQDEVECNRSGVQ